MSGVMRPWLLALADAGLFSPIWSDRIGREWQRNAARIWSIEPELLQAEWQKMQTRFASANVSRWSTSIDNPMPALKYSDEKDWHVIEAAWHARQANPLAATGIVTINIKDFSRSELRRLGLDLWEPDRLLSKWHDTHATRLVQALNTVIKDLVDSGRRHPATPSDFLMRERLFRTRKLFMGNDNSSN